VCQVEGLVEERPRAVVWGNDDRGGDIPETEVVLGGTIGRWWRWKLGGRGSRLYWVHLLLSLSSSSLLILSSTAMSSRALFSLRTISLTLLLVMLLLLEGGLIWTAFDRADPVSLLLVLSGVKNGPLLVSENKGLSDLFWNHFLQCLCLSDRPSEQEIPY
jgi:hypothetical protein